MFDIFFIYTREAAKKRYKKLKEKYPTARAVSNFRTAQQTSLTDFFWVVWDDLELLDDFNLDYKPDSWSHKYVHVFLNDNKYNGICLVPKTEKITDKEINYRFFVNKKEIPIQATTTAKYDQFVIDSHDEYLYALANTSTELFWALSKNISLLDNLNLTFSYDNKYDRKTNHNFIHRVENKDLRNGVFLLSTHNTLSRKEIEHRFLVNAKQWNIVASGPVEYDKFIINNYKDYEAAYNSSKTEMFWVVPSDVDPVDEFKFDLYFSHDNVYDRNTHHVFLNDKNYDGICLLTKTRKLTKKEINFRFIVDRKEWPIIASVPKPFDRFQINNYKDYKNALKSAKTDMFWSIPSDIKIVNFDFEKSLGNQIIDRNVTHVMLNGKYRDGIVLFSKNSAVSEKEFEYRFYANKKEWDIVASYPKKYDRFEVKNYQDYLYALENSTTNMFWIVPDYLEPAKQFDYDVYYPHYETFERSINHVYLNGKYHDGIMLCSKHSPISEKEFNYTFIAHKKEIPIVISTPNPYDVVFISYQEPNAEDNYKKLLKKIPTAKRIHGVKGIHQAHIAAAKLCSTDMFWIVDGDAQIVDNFNFDYQVARWDRDTVYVWRSQNPINDLVYGYGGVKLFPRELTINMDISKPDMTTSISKKFKAVQEISNITAFNTDPFNTWKSAFRECTKLSSKIIDRQKDDETEDRLHVWQTVGEERPYGEWAIKGAKAGTAYGTASRGNIEALKKINDFDWLEEQFNAGNV
jgi:hypothetical protein